jgi:hypothetical protein
MTTPIDTIREALATAAAMAMRLREANTADGLRAIFRDQYPKALEALSQLEQQPTAWMAVVRYPNGETSTRYASTEDAVRQLAKEAYHSPELVSVQPLYAAPQQPDTAKLVEAGEAQRRCDYRNRECSNNGKTINGVWTCDQHYPKSAAPLPHSCPPHIAHPAKGGGYVCSACDLRMDAALVAQKCPSLNVIKDWFDVAYGQKAERLHAGYANPAVQGLFTAFLAGVNHAILGDTGGSDLKRYAAPVTPKRLTDEEIERCYQRRYAAHAHAGLTPEGAHNAASEYRAGMLQARLRYTGGLSVEQVMEVVKEWYADEYRTGRGVTMYDNWKMLRDRLTKAVNEHGG